MRRLKKRPRLDPEDFPLQYYSGSSCLYRAFTRSTALLALLQLSGNFQPCTVRAFGPTPRANTPSNILHRRVPRKQGSTASVRVLLSHEVTVEDLSWLEDDEESGLPCAFERVRDESTSSLSISTLPPWLERHQVILPETVEEEIQWFKEALKKRGFSSKDTMDIMKAVYLASGGEQSRIVGCISFCKILLKMEEDTTTTITTSTTNMDIGSCRRTPPSFLATKVVVLASILHYSECITARQDGIYNQICEKIGVAESWESFQLNASESQRNATRQNHSLGNEMVLMRTKDVNDNLSLSYTMFPQSRVSVSGKKTNSEEWDVFSIESIRLAKSASKIKRAEIIARVVLMNRGPLNGESYDDLRNLLLSLTDDWRALAIRCVASLYRLEGAVESMLLGTGEYSRHKSSEVTINAKDSLRVYATLAQRMGFHRLKAHLEANAFRILYPRQYSAASTLFQDHGAGMRAMSEYLSNQMKKTLIEDPSLMYELETLQVSARVKEPYSFWKKILKQRLGGSYDGIETGLRIRASNGLSVLDVSDGVALRVILKARKITVDESEETTRSRERMLCYYVQRVLRSQWPEIDQSRLKDYIRFPKPNGYQSLHHTSKISRNGQDFFFEVQVRSEEMHHSAEWGIASHWTYKLNKKPLRVMPAKKGESQSCSNTSSSLSKQEEPTSIVPLDSEKKGSLDSEKKGSVATAEVASYIHALEESRRSLIQSHVYVFLAGSLGMETGQLLSLPAGCLVLDVLQFLREREGYNFGDDNVYIWKNGKLAFLEEEVRNGDMLTIEPVQSRAFKASDVPLVAMVRA